VNGQVSYTWLSYDVNRKVQLGPATRRHGGSPDGSNLTAALNAGYEFGTGRLPPRPDRRVIWQKVKIDGYTESNLAWPPRWATTAERRFDRWVASAGRPASMAAPSSRTPG
jgi:uncharacterized protein with beta-barrel porin domain